MKPNFKIGIVGACGTGKSELVSRLRADGYLVRHIAQEHSYAPRMWRQIADPDFLVYLHVSYPNTLVRKKFKWTEKEFQEQLHRLRHARIHADVEIDTDRLTPNQVYEGIIANIQSLKP